MGDVAYQGRTVLFVSHNMTTVTALCSQCYHLDRGHIVVSGKTSDVVQRYVDTIHYTKIRPLTERTDRRGDGRVRFTQAALLSGDGNPIETAFSGQSIVILLSYAANQDISLNNVVFSIGVYTPLGQFLFFCNNEMSGTVFDRLPPTGVVRCMIPRLPLSPGRYDLNINVEVNGVQADWVPQAIALNVEGGDFFGTGRLPPSSHGGFLVPQSWSISLCLCV
jgi:lipopolysaccharide transport system ATP-binding protein